MIHQKYKMIDPKRIIDASYIFIFEANLNNENLDSTSFYVGRRFCTSCCKPWQDVDFCLDAAAAESGRLRTEIYKNLRAKGELTKFSACCTRALFPCQHTLKNLPDFSFLAIDSKLPLEIDTLLACTSSRPRVNASGARSRREVHLLNQYRTVDAIEKLLIQEQETQSKA